MESTASRQLIAFLLILVIIVLTPKYMEWVAPAPKTENSNQTTDYQEPEQLDYSKQPKLYNEDYLSQDPATMAGNQILFDIETPLYIAKISNAGGGSVAEFILKEFFGSYSDNGDYQEYLEVSMLLPSENSCTPCITSRNEITGERIYRNDFFFTNVQNNESIVLESGQIHVVDFWFDYNDGTSIKNTITFNAESYYFDFDYEINHLPEQDLNPEIAWTAGIRPSEKKEADDITDSGAIIWQAGDSENLNISSNEILNLDIIDGTTDWVAAKSKYFITAIIPEFSGIYGGFSGKNVPFGSRKITPLYQTYIGYNDNTNIISGKIFIGPQEVKHLRLTKSNLEDAMNWGYFIIRPISKFILNLLTFFHKPIKEVEINYGLVLILFAVLIRILTGPLTKKAALSNQKIQELQPLLKKLQAKHKDDPMRLQQETMKIWRENKVNPLGGCLPILVQMPLLFALFVTFRSTIEFRGAPFTLWINDLSQPDTIFYLPFHIPIYGNHVAVLPIIMGVSMFLQQKITSATMDKNQKPMMYMMTAFFFLIFNSFPSGLNLYYATSNFLNIIQQRNLKKASQKVLKKS